MRELKFRLFAKQSKEMITWDKLPSLYKLNVLNDNEDNDKYSPFMQYTGLKDKYEKEIYEGDIIIGKSYGDDYPLIIKWDCEYSGFYCHDPKGDEDDHLNLREAADGYIIGNVYENPELLSK